MSKINDDPNKFKISIILGFIEHISIIGLTIMLFIVFNQYNVILGIIWTIFRTGEALIYIYNEIKYWELLNISRQYSITSGAEKESVSILGRNLLQSKFRRYTLAMILFSVGTLAYSILFITNELGNVIPPFIGWIGIFASVSFGLGNILRFVKANYEGLAIMAIGGLLVILFESIIGVWLLFYGRT